MPETDGGRTFPEAKPSAPLEALETSPSMASAPPQQKSPIETDFEDRPKATSVAPLTTDGGACKDLERQLAQSITKHGENHISVAKTLLALGVERRREGKIDAAIAHLERGIGVLETIVVDPGDARIVIKMLTELATCCTTHGRLDDSTALLNRAVEVAVGSGDDAEAGRLREELKSVDVERKQAAAKARAAGGRGRGSPNRPGSSGGGPLPPKKLFP